MGMRALCVFHDHGDHVLRRFLKPGFRHCFVAVASDAYWITLDSKMGAPEIRVTADSQFDLAGFYRDAGFTVVETALADSATAGTGAGWLAAPLALTTCVGMTKRLLGLRAPGVFTPWQLCRRLWGDALSSRRGAAPEPSDADKLFRRYRENLKPREGGFVDNPTDPGGPTQKGMSQRELARLRKRPEWKFLPSWSKDLTDRQIDRIFRAEYFDRPNIDKLANVPGLSVAAPGLAEQVFDIGIQHGIGQAGTWLQESLDEVLGTDLRVSRGGHKTHDGVIGPVTRRAVARAVRQGKIRQVNNAVVARRLNSMTANSRVKDNAGWLRRAEFFRMAADGVPQIPGRVDSAISIPQTFS